MKATRIYYLEDPLSEEDVSFVSSELCGGGPIEQVRIPYVLPLVPEGGWTPSDEEKSEKLLRNHLKACGMKKDQGKQVVLVAPKDTDWYVCLARAVTAETGLRPFLVQTEKQRDAIGNPGSLRILDMAALLGEKT